MRVKVISDGTCKGTKLVNSTTDETIEGVKSIDWSCRPPQPPQCVVSFTDVKAEAEAFVEVEP